MARQTRVTWATQEQIVSNDLNRIGQLISKATFDLARAATNDPVLQGDPPNVVLEGLEITQGTNLQVTISAGSALIWVGTAIDQDNSGYRYGRLDASTNVDLTAADPGNGRIDLIYATTTDTGTDSQSRQVLQLPARTFSGQTINKTSFGVLNLQVVAGTPASSPQLPAVPAGGIAIAYVHVQTGVTDIANNDILDARLIYAEQQLPPKGSRILNGLSIRTFIDATSTNQITIATGSGVSALRTNILVPTSITFTPRIAIAGVPAALTASTQYYVYLVGPGPTSPVSLAQGAGFAGRRYTPVISTIVPAPDGTPTTPIAYRPWQQLLVGTPGPANSITTQAALYVGSFITDENGDTRGDDSNVLASSDGSVFVARTRLDAVATNAAENAWIQKPKLQFLSSGALQVRLGVGLIAGSIGGRPDQTLTGTLATDFVTGQSAVLNTFTYVFIRRATSGITRAPNRGRYVVRFSTEAPVAGLGVASPESGFTAGDYIYCGAVWINSNSTINPFVMEGDTHFYIDKLPYLGTPSDPYFGSSGVQGFLTVSSATAPLSANQMTTATPATTRLSIQRLAVDDTAATSISLWVWHFDQFRDTLNIDQAAYYWTSIAPTGFGPFEVIVDDNGAFALAGFQALPNGSIVENINIGFREDVNNPFRTTLPPLGPDAP